MKQRLTFILLENGHLTMEWETVSKQPKDLEKGQLRLTEFFKQKPVQALFALGFWEEHDDYSPSLNFWLTVAREYVGALRRTPELETIRHKVAMDLDDSVAEALIDAAPFFQGAEYLSAEVLAVWWKAMETFFQKEIKKFKGSVEDYLHQYLPNLHLVGKVHFHLVENRKGSAAPFAFLATYAAAVNKKGEFSHRPLQYALKEYEEKQEQLVTLLATVYTAAEKCTLIKGLLDSGELFYPLSFRSDDAYQFLQHVGAYEEDGILCRIPNWWKRSYGGPKASLSFGEKKKSLVGLESLVDFNASIILGDLEVTLDEAREILQQTDGLAFIKGRWVPIDHDKLKRTLEQLDAAQSLMDQDGVTLAEAMKMLLHSDKGLLGDLSENEVEVGLGDWITTVFDKMRHPDRVDSVKPPREFKATLRPYQEVGLNWLNFLGGLGFGACLADDMGLGKTIQVLALLSGLRRKKSYTPSLLVVPASLIGNWSQEIETFAPKVSFAVAHSSAGNDQLGKTAKEGMIAGNDLVITTYGLVKRYDWIRDYDWNYVILDEAQAIKNPGTAQTKAVKSLKSANRLVLTGTPIENKLADLWSLFDFLNPGLLGNKTEFTGLVKKHQGNLGQIRQVISPFILRRLKTDKTIISDLPDKIEMETYAELTKKQAVLYREVVGTLIKSLEDTEGIQRKGLVLASLMKFKQICNHPAQFLGSNDYVEKHSGKFTRLREICETIAAKREKVLIFTQFKETTQPLADFLETVFGRPGLVLHGGTQVKKRTELVKKFQSDEYVPFFILSVKAGGTGLNLTAANHVIHFDRWWNPAVENQATDRAFRIGQKKSVLVHKFVTKGTVEEKIATMLREKQKLSDDILGGDGSGWITELSNDEIKDLFTLRSPTPGRQTI